MMQENCAHKKAYNIKEGTILEHLAELRYRLIAVFTIWLVLTVIAFVYSSQILRILFIPINNAFPENSLVGVTPADAFILKIKASLVAGFVGAFPFIIWHAWRFVSPGLHESEKRLAVPLMVLSLSLFLIGISFSYFVIVPFALDFFESQYKSANIAPFIRSTSYLGFLMKTVLGFGITFQLPVVTYLLVTTGIISYRILLSAFRYAVVAIFALSAVLTPPDVLTQFLMAGPLIVLYVISLIIAYTCERRNS